MQCAIYTPHKERAVVIATVLPALHTVAFLPHDNVSLGIKRAVEITRLRGNVQQSLVCLIQFSGHLVSMFSQKFIVLKTAGVAMIISTSHRYFGRCVPKSSSYLFCSMLNGKTLTPF